MKYLGLLESFRQRKAVPSYTLHSICSQIDKVLRRPVEIATQNGR